MPHNALRRPGIALLAAAATQNVRRYSVTMEVSMPRPGISTPYEEHLSPRTMLELIAANRITQAIYVVAELGIADLLKDGPRSAEEIAKAAGASEDGVYRLLRALASLGLFASLPGRRFELTPSGQSLRVDAPGSLRAWARFNGHEIMWRPWGELLYSVKTGKSAFDHVFGATVFEYSAKHSDAGVALNDAMTAFSAIDSAALAEAYDYSAIGTLVDIGGGHGFLLTALLRANSSLRGILFDLPHVVQGAVDRFRHEGLANRCAVVGGDFFDAIPDSGDAYAMKFIIHDWDDDRAIRILRNCRRVMRGGAKLLVIERVLSAGDDPDFGKFSDLQMLVFAPSGRERTEAEFRSLYDAAGLRLTRVVPTTSPLSIIEGVPQ